METIEYIKQMLVVSPYVWLKREMCFTLAKDNSIGGVGMIHPKV